MRRALAVAVLFLATAAHAQNAADVATARDLFREGMELRAHGKLSEALAKLKAAHDLYETPPSALELARAQIDSALLAEGYETLLSIDRIPITKESDRSKQARGEAKDLADKVKARIPTLLVKLTGDTSGAIVALDGTLVPASVLGVARKVNPGHHVITVRNAAGNERKVDIDLAEGQAEAASIEAPVTETRILGAIGGGVVPQQLPPQNDRFSVLYKFLPPDPSERWSLRTHDGARLCVLPCERWIGENSGLYLERLPTAHDVERRRVDVPLTLPATVGSVVNAKPHAGAGSSAIGVVGGLLGTFGVLGAIGGASTLVVGLVNLSSPGNTGRDFTIAGGTMLGSSIVMLVVGIVLTNGNYPARMDYVVSRSLAEAPTN